MKYLPVKCRFLIAVLSMLFLGQKATAQASVLFTAPPDGTGNYQWQYYDNTSGTYVSIVGATAATYTTLVTGIFQVVYTSTSFPTVGNPAYSGVYYAAPNDTYPVSLDASDNTVGTFQWQISTDGTTYTNIAGATSNIYYITSNTAIAYYHLVITTGGISTTAPIFVAPINPSVIAPVSLTSFTGTASGCTAALAWATSLESNSSYYAVEASSDASSFTQVGKVASKNSPTGATYSYACALGSGTGYFRLKAVDNDGKFTYSSIVSVTGTGACGTALSVKVSPNPTKNMLTIQGLDGGKNRLALYDMNGKKMAEVLATGTSQRMNISGYAMGVYVLRIENAGGNVGNVKVVKD